MTDQKLVDELEKALTDEVYDGGMGALSEEQFSELVRTLASTAATVFEKVHTPTDDERIEAWCYVADHEAFKACYAEEQPLIDSVLARITQLHELEATVNELAPAPEQGEPSDAPSLITRVGWLRQSTERERLDVPFNGEVARAARLAVLDDVIAALRAAGVGGAR